MSISLSNQDKLTLISNLATLLSAGIPLIDAVDSLLQETSGNQKKILSALKNDIKEGKTIASSFSRFPKAFDPVTVNLIKAAEESGNLDQVLKDLTIQIKKDIEFSDRVKAALMYPIVVIIVFILVLLLILIYVIPRIAKVFKMLKFDLPLPTKILIAASNILLSYSIPIIISIFLFFIFVIFLYKRKKTALLNFVFSLPFLFSLGRDIDLTRFTRSMGLLLGSGISIAHALELSLKVVTNRKIKSVIAHSRKLVLGGKNLSDGLKAGKGLIPGTMKLIIEAGEKTGKLDISMQELAEYFDSQTEKKLKVLTTLLEPILLVIVALMVGGVMLAIVAPIYKLIGQITPRSP